jgi:hypothetical protein
MVADIQSITDQVEERDGLYLGQWRRPVNSAIHISGSIHDDDMAARLGFRGGTVSGAVHLDLFPPVMLRAFGERWFENGSVSIYWLDPTVDREEVRAVVAVPPRKDNVQVQTWAERPDGRRIGEGTASVGDPGEPSALMARDISKYPPGELRILEKAVIGDRIPEITVEVTPEIKDWRLSVVTDPLPWYIDESPWGGPIATSYSLIDNLMRLPFTEYLKSVRQTDPVSLYGAIELHYVNGPVFVGKPYRAGGTIASLGQSPKTEHVWFDAYLDDPVDGKRVVTMRMMYRFMKDSSPLYQ